MLVPQFPGAEEDEEEGEGEAGDHQPHARDHLDVLAGQAVRQEELLIYHNLRLDIHNDYIA